MACWHYNCKNNPRCVRSSFACADSIGGDYSFLSDACPISQPNSTLFDFGMFLPALQSGNLQTYLQMAITKSEEKKRQVRESIKLWAYNNNLPKNIKGRMMQYVPSMHQNMHFDVESLLPQFSWQLQRDIKRHLCLDLHKTLPVLLRNVEGEKLDAILDILNPVAYQKFKNISQGGPLDKLLDCSRQSKDPEKWR